MDKITEFQGQYRFLSNFWFCHLKVYGLTFQSSEAAYQASKTEDPKERERFTHMSPGTAKREGAKLPWNPNFNKLAAMSHVVAAKFEQNLDLKRLLWATHPLILEEGNRWHDRFWGICPPNSGQGQNHLGRILMGIRDVVRQDLMD